MKKYSLAVVLGLACQLVHISAAALASCEVESAACGQSMIQMGASPAQRTIALPSRASGTVWAFVATDVYAGVKVLQAAMITLAGEGGFGGDVILATDMPKCALTTIFTGIDQEAVHLASQLEPTNPQQFALFRDNQTEWSLRSTGTPASNDSPASALPAHVATVNSAHLGITLHLIQLEPGELFDAKLAKTHVWDFARLAGLQPEQIIYQDADILVGESLAPFLAFIDGHAEATPGIPTVLTNAESQIVERVKAGIDTVQVPANGNAGDENTDWIEIQIASAAEAGHAGTLLFGSYFNGHNPRHGGLIVTRAGAGEMCMEEWRTAMLKMKAEDPELFEDQPALATIQCNFAYLPWQFMNFPTPETLTGSRTAVFMHFAANSIMHLFELFDDSHILDDFLSDTLGLHILAKHLMDTTRSGYCIEFSNHDD
mmetsp:Transcript_69711/g.130117  ORF Transcript_69711/g.130117 Transcript_69711/m.130117 type:complete len:430 (+) Transcript_69711:68-1357(+)